MSHSDSTKEQLDDYREQLYQDAETSLEESKIKHVENIDALLSQFERRLSLLGHCEQQLSSPVINESANTSSFDDHNAGVGSDSQPLLLSERMAEFSALLKAKEEALRRLFDEWNDVQDAMIALAVKTLGQDAVAIEEDQLHPKLARAVSDASAKHAAAEKQATDHQETVNEMETRAKDLATKTVNAVDKAFEVSEQLTLKTLCANQLQAYKLKMEKMQKQAEDLKVKREQLESEWFGP